MIELAVIVSFVSLLINFWQQYKYFQVSEEIDDVYMLHELEAMKTENFKQEMIDNKEDYGELIERLIEASLKK